VRAPAGDAAAAPATGAIKPTLVMKIIAAKEIILYFFILQSFN